MEGLCFFSAFIHAVTVTPCSSEPCLNSAECFDNGVDNYACVCPDGFTGDNCENGNKINELK